MPSYINFFGTGIRYWVCRFSRDEMVELRSFQQEHSLSLEDIFLDLHTLKRFGYSDIEELNIIHSGSGWIIEDRNWIEVKRRRKKKKIETKEFLGEGLMFDIYQKERSAKVYSAKEGYEDLMILQYEKGLIAKYELPLENCDLDRFSFILNPGWIQLPNGRVWVEDLCYDDTKLKKVKEDSLVTDDLVRFIK